MQIKFLGTGGSHGIPNIGCQCAVCQSTDARDKRLRSSVFIETNGVRFLIDPGPDLRTQALHNNITAVDAVLVTHEHKDHTAGIDDIRSFNYLMKSKIPFFAQQRVTKTIATEYAYAFAEPHYPGAPEIDLHTIGSQVFDVKGVSIVPIEVLHGSLPTTGFRIGNFAYITDAKIIPHESMLKLHNLDMLVINALRTEEHRAHLNLTEALDIIQQLQPRCAYLTHMSHRLPCHSELERILPSNVRPAFDGLVIDL